MNLLLGVLVNGILGLVKNAISFGYNKYKLWRLEKGKRGAELDYFEEKTKTRHLMRKAKAKKELRKNLDKIKKPKEFAEWVEQDKKL